MAFRWREHHITGEPILMNDEEAARHDDATVHAGMAVLMLVLSQMMLPSDISWLVRIPLGLFSLAVGFILGHCMLGVGVAIVSTVVSFMLFSTKGDATFMLIYISGIIGVITNLIYFKVTAGPQPQLPSEMVQSSPVKPSDAEIRMMQQDRAERLRANGHNSGRKNKMPKGFKSNFD